MPYYKIHIAIYSSIFFKTESIFFGPNGPSPFLFEKTNFYSVSFTIVISNAPQHPYLNNLKYQKKVACWCHSNYCIWKFPFNSRSSVACNWPIIRMKL